MALKNANIPVAWSFDMETIVRISYLHVSFPSYATPHFLPVPADALSPKCDK